MTKGRFVPSSTVCDVDGRAVRFALCVQLSQSLITAVEVSATLPFVIPSVPGFPATLHWTQPRVRFSVGENSMKSVNANKINRKSGVAEGPAVSLSGTAKEPWANRLSGFRFAINANCWVPHCPDFLWRLAALTHFMRLSLLKGAHADLSSTAWQEIGVKPGFGLSGIPQHSTREFVLICHLYRG